MCFFHSLYFIHWKVLQRWLHRFHLWTSVGTQVIKPGPSAGTDSWDKRLSVESFSSDVHIFIPNLGWGKKPALSSSVGAWSPWALTSSSGSSLSLCLPQTMSSQARLLPWFLPQWLDKGGVPNLYLDLYPRTRLVSSSKQAHSQLLLPDEVGINTHVHPNRLET